MCKVDLVQAGLLNSFFFYQAAFHGGDSRTRLCLTGYRFDAGMKSGKEEGNL